jgi:hypothetical protein
VIIASNDKFNVMKKIFLIGLIISTLIGCDKETDSVDKSYIAEIVGFDLNCSTCILHFPHDSENVKEFIGDSKSDFYNSVNLNQTDFKIGELIQVRVRIAEDNELRACKTLYPTINYTNIYVSDFSKYQDSHFIDSVDLKYGECVTTYGQSSVCFDTVLNESRCPEGGMCVWEGNAKIKLRVSVNGIGEHEIELNTNKSFSIDTTINHLNIFLISLTPYPDISMTIIPRDYIAKLSIANLSTIESNAQIISFNPDKEACSWGWTIKMDNDTIKSDDIIIGETVGFEITEPIDVYVQLGTKERDCTMTGMDYYETKRIIVVE